MRAAGAGSCREVRSLCWHSERYSPGPWSDTYLEDKRLSFVLQIAVLFLSPVDLAGHWRTFVPSTSGLTSLYIILTCSHSYQS